MINFTLSLHKVKTYLTLNVKHEVFVIAHLI